MATALPSTASELVQKTLSEVSQSHPGSKMSLGIIISLWSAPAGQADSQSIQSIRLASEYSLPPIPKVAASGYGKWDCA